MIEEIPVELEQTTIERFVEDLSPFVTEHENPELFYLLGVLTLLGMHYKRLTTYEIEVTTHRGRLQFSFPVHGAFAVEAFKQVVEDVRNADSVPAFEGGLPAHERATQLLSQVWFSGLLDLYIGAKSRIPWTLACLAFGLPAVPDARLKGFEDIEEVTYCGLYVGAYTEFIDYEYYARMAKGWFWKSLVGWSRSMHDPDVYLSNDPLILDPRDINGVRHAFCVAMYRRSQGHVTN